MNAAGRILALGLTGLCLAGCFARASRVDANWGSAVRANTRSMLANPAGVAARVTPDDPTDGESAQAAMEKYRTIEARPPRPPPTSTIINIGGR
jgi:hypothetical protein